MPKNKEAYLRGRADRAKSSAISNPYPRETFFGNPTSSSTREKNQSYREGVADKEREMKKIDDDFRRRAFLARFPGGYTVFFTSSVRDAI